MALYNAFLNLLPKFCSNSEAKTKPNTVLQGIIKSDIIPFYQNILK